jgi:UDP-N-acetylglucosamine 2-epimerase (non-hydrolysing)
LKRISVIFGTRPEAIKLAPVIMALKKCSKIGCDVCVTAQHREMLDQMLEVFDTKPDSDLNVMRPNQTLAELTTRSISALDAYIASVNPDLILVQGDTTTTFAAALTAFYYHIPVAHVEAGLRTGNLESPWPEEANRILVSRLAALHFAPTELNRRNLLSEGVRSDRVFVTGNTVIDALFLTLENIRKKGLRNNITTDLTSRFPSLGKLFASDKKSAAGGRIILVTGHRRENFGHGFEEICRALRAIAENHPEVEIVYPVHLNPNVQEPVRRILSGCSNVHLIRPLDYLPFVYLMDQSYMIITDSGGVQEEAPSLGKPVLVMRDTTERPEAVNAGTVKLVGANSTRIVTETNRLLEDKNVYEKMSKAQNPYGDGKAASRILEKLAGWLCRRG